MRVHLAMRLAMAARGPRFYYQGVSDFAALPPRRARSSARYTAQVRDIMRRREQMARVNSGDDGPRGAAEIRAAGRAAVAVTADAQKKKNKNLAGICPTKTTPAILRGITSATPPSSTPSVGEMPDARGTRSPGKRSWPWKSAHPEQRVSTIVGGGRCGWPVGVWIRRIWRVPVV